MPMRCCVSPALNSLPTPAAVRAPWRRIGRLLRPGCRLAAASDESDLPSSGMRNASEAAEAGVGGAMEYSLTELSKRDGRAQGTNLFLVGSSMEEWRKVDAKVNKYPIQRSFTAIGSGGEAFKASMIKAVEDVVGTVHQECVSERSSSKGAYISVTVGPVWVETCDQIIEVYSRMKEKGSDKIKWII